MVRKLWPCAPKSSQSKVSDQQPGVGSGVVVQEVLRLQVSVGDAQIVQVPHPGQRHPQGLGGVPLGEVAPADHAVQQLPAGRQLQHRVDPPRELKHLDQLDHVSVAHPPQHRQLRGAHLSTLGGLHLHHLYGERLASRPVLHSHHAAEASTTDQGFDVVSDGAEGGGDDSLQRNYLTIQGWNALTSLGAAAAVMYGNTQGFRSPENTAIF